MILFVFVDLCAIFTKGTTKKYFFPFTYNRNEFHQTDIEKKCRIGNDNKFADSLHLLLLPFELRFQSVIFSTQSSRYLTAYKDIVVEL